MWLSRAEFLHHSTLQSFCGCFQVPISMTFTFAIDQLFILRRFLADSRVLKALIQDLVYSDECWLHTYRVRCRKTWTAFLDPVQQVRNHISACSRQEVNVSCYICVWEVDRFVYLGSTLSQDNYLNRKMYLKMEKAARYFGLLYKIVWS